MFKNKFFSLLAISVFLSFSVAHAAEREQTVRIYAASSLTNVLNELAEQYMQQHPIKIVPIYGGSSSLARQIEQGAPADLFISANELWVEHLEKRGVVSADNVHQFAGNHLVVVTPKADNAKLDIHQAHSWLDILADGRLAVGQPNAVPAGIYAKQALETLKVWSALRTHLAPTNNVRNVLTLVERGEAPLGIVYSSDAKSSDKVRVIHAFADSTHEPIHYPLVQLSASEASKGFMHFLLSDEAKQTLLSFGFN